MLIEFMAPFSSPAISLFEMDLEWGAFYGLWCTNFKEYRLMMSCSLCDTPVYFSCACDNRKVESSFPVAMGSLLALLN